MVRAHCHQKKKEDMIYMIYDFAAQREFNLTLAETTRNTT